MRFHPLLLLATASIALASCADEAEPEQVGDDARKAKGEVLGGSISDSMLPLDTVTSQSPPLREETNEDDATDGGEDADTDDAAPAESAEPAPAVTPGPAAPAAAPEEPAE